MNTKAVQQMLRAELGPGTYLTRDGLAHKYGVSLRSIDRWFQRGWAEPYFTLNRVWIRVEDLAPHLAPKRRTRRTSRRHDSAN